MAFTDRLVEYPNRYTMTDASGNTSTVYLEPAPGEVTQEGTLLNAENLNSEVAALAQEATGAASKGNRGKTVTVQVAFPQAFSATPIVVVTPLTGRPDAVRASVVSLSATGCTVCLYRSTAVGDSNTSVAWIAML